MVVSPKGPLVLSEDESLLLPSRLARVRAKSDRPAEDDLDFDLSPCDC